MRIFLITAGLGTLILNLVIAIVILITTPHFMPMVQFALAGLGTAMCVLGLALER